MNLKPSPKKSLRGYLFILSLLFMMSLYLSLVLNPYTYRWALSYFTNNTIRQFLFFIGTFTVRYCPLLIDSQIEYLGKTFTNWGGKSYLYQFLFLNQTYEYPIYQYAKSRLGEGDIFIDVGANEGFFPILFSDLIGKTGQSYAIEANPGNVDLMERNIRKNNSQNITVLNTAVAGRSGPATLYDCHTNKMWSSVNVPHSECFVYSKKRIRMITLDELVLQEKMTLSRIKLIKIDVEGGELEVLRGATQLLKHSVADWIIEVNLRVYSLTDILSLFPQHTVTYFPQHYALYFPTSNKSPIIPIPYLEDSVLHHTVNMIFTRK